MIFFIIRITVLSKVTFYFIRIIKNTYSLSVRQSKVTDVISKLKEITSICDLVNKKANE